MRKLLWPTQVGLVTLALVFMPAEAGDGRLSGAALCAAEASGEDCEREYDSYCEVNGKLVVDVTPKESQ